MTEPLVDTVVERISISFVLRVIDVVSSITSRLYFRRADLLTLNSIERNRWQQRKIESIESIYIDVGQMRGRRDFTSWDGSDECKEDIQGSMTKALYVLNYDRSFKIELLKIRFQS